MYVCGKNLIYSFLIFDIIIFSLTGTVIFYNNHLTVIVRKETYNSYYAFPVIRCCTVSLSLIIVFCDKHLLYLDHMYVLYICYIFILIEKLTTMLMIISFSFQFYRSVFFVYDFYIHLKGISSYII